MALPTTFGPATEAIYEALTTATGKSRAIATEHLFLKIADKRGDVDLASQAMTRKRVLVVFKDITSALGPEVQPSDRLRYTGTVEILRVYHAGNDLFSSEMERARELAANDLHRMRAALCWPGALEKNAALEETGIDGFALNAIGHRSIGPAKGSGVITWLDLYPFTVSLLVS